MCIYLFRVYQTDLSMKLLWFSFKIAN